MSKKIANILKHWVLDSSFTQGQLAKEFEISQPVLSRQLNGIESMPRARIYELIKLLNPPPEEVMEVEKYLDDSKEHLRPSSSAAYGMRVDSPANGMTQEGDNEELKALLKRDKKQRIHERELLAKPENADFPFSSSVSSDTELEILKRDAKIAQYRLQIAYLERKVKRLQDLNFKETSEDEKRKKEKA